MKKVILLALAFTATLCANAQRLIDGSLKNLTQIKAIQVVFEYKNAVVQGLPYAEFMEKEQREFSNRNYKDFKDEWNRSLAPELLYRFIEGYNKIANRKNLLWIIADWIAMDRHRQNIPLPIKAAVKSPSCNGIRLREEHSEPSRILSEMPVKRMEKISQSSFLPRR